MSNVAQTSEDASRLSSLLALFGSPELNRYQLGFLAASLLALLIAPFWAGPMGFLYVMAFANIYAIFTMSWDIISGHTGYISFGHSFLSGIAAYTTAILLYVVNPEMSLAITAPVSVIMALVAGMLFAVPSLRLSGPYFSLLTFVAVLIAFKLVYVFSDYTNGEMGIGGLPVLSYNTFNLYYITLVPMLIIGAILLFISRSNIGLVLKAIQENENTVEAAGLDTVKFKLWGFVFSAIPMGIGGVLIAHFYGNVEPIGVLIVDRSIEMIAMSAVGGMGTILGPMGGAYVLLVLRDSVFRAFLGPNMRWVAFWATVLLLLVGPELLGKPSGIFRWLWQYLGNLGKQETTEVETEPGLGGDD